MLTPHHSGNHSNHVLMHAYWSMVSFGGLIVHVSPQADHL